MKSEVFRKVKCSVIGIDRNSGNSSGLMRRVRMPFLFDFKMKISDRSPEPIARPPANPK